MSVDLESLKQIFQGSERVSLAVVQRVEVTSDLSTVRALCRELPDENQIVARFSFAHCSQGTGFFTLPRTHDFVVVVYPDEDTPIIVGFLTSKTDPLPAQVRDGDTMLKAAQKLHLVATKLNLGKGDPDAEPTEPLVLGNVLLGCLTDLWAVVDGIAQALVTGPIGIDSFGAPVIPHPTLISALQAEQADLDTAASTYLDTADTNIVSQIAYTERGD